MAVIEGTRKVKTWTGEYDFAVDGGAISTIPFRSNDGAIPAGAVIERGYIDVTTLPTSGGAATIRGDSEAAGDLFAATAIATFVANTRRNVLPAPGSGSATAGTHVKTTAARVPAITIAAFALTAGKFTLTLFYK
jgi:hypothetical protein